MSLSCSFLPFSNPFCGKVLETFVILSTVLLPMKSPVSSELFFL